MSDIDIEQAAELAARKWIRAADLEWLRGAEGGADRVYCGMENRDNQEAENQESSIIRLPCVICGCYSAEPVLPNFHGNWNATLRIEIISSQFDSTAAEHSARVRDVTKLLLTTTIADDLSKATEEFYVAKVSPAGRGYSFDGARWVSFQEYSLISCCSIPV